MILLWNCVTHRSSRGCLWFSKGLPSLTLFNFVASPVRKLFFIAFDIIPPDWSISPFIWCSLFSPKFSQCFIKHIFYRKFFSAFEMSTWFLVTLMFFRYFILEFVLFCFVIVGFLFYPFHYLTLGTMQDLWYLPSSYLRLQ